MKAQDWKFLLNHCKGSLALAYLLCGKEEATVQVALDLEKIMATAESEPKKLLLQTAFKVVEIFADDHR